MATTTRDAPPGDGPRPERLRREDPERIAPRRDRIPRPAAAPPQARPDADLPEGERAPRPFGDAVTHGVDLGYHVIEEQIRQGRRVAEEISRASYGPAAMSDDVRETTERMWRYYSDLGRLWFDFVTAFTPFGRSGSWPPGVADVWGGRDDAWGRREPARGPERTRESETGMGSPVSVEIASRRPVRVSLDLRPGSPALDLYTPELRAAGRAGSPLIDARFERAPPGCTPTLCIRVPDDTDPDTYVGVVIDRQSGRHVGTLSVCVSQ